MRVWQFSLLGFPVEVRPSFWLLTGVYVLLAVQRDEPVWTAAVFGGVVFVSILVHELGHGVMARRLRVPVGAITLYALGGYVTHAATTPGRQLLVSLAGPGAGLVLGFAGLALHFLVPDHRVLQVVLNSSHLVNIGWSLFNLLPLYPLDGGRALSAILTVLVGPGPGWLIAGGVGTALGVALVGVGAWWGDPFLMFLGGSSTWQNASVVAAAWRTVMAR